MAGRFRSQNLKSKEEGMVAAAAEYMYNVRSW